MAETIGSKKDLPLDWTTPEEGVKGSPVLLGQDVRIRDMVKIAFCLLASAAAFGIAAAICFTLAPVLGVVFLVGSVALATLGIAVGLNAIADRLPKCLRKTVHLIHAVVTETFSFALVGLLYPWQGLCRKQITPGAVDERPILLIHGYLHNSSGWVYMMDELKKAGFKSVYAVSLWHPFRSIDDYVPFIQETAQKIAEETKQKDLIIVGHSMGGLVASKAALTMPDKGVNVTDLFTLASPLKGTPLAKIGLGPNARQMQTNSEFTQDLEVRIAKNEKNIRFFEAASSMDEIVPKKYALLGQKGRQLVLNDLGHIGMLFSPRVADWIIASLRPSI